MNLSVEGRLLKNPNAQLCESNLTSLSTITCECNPVLYGGMQNPSPEEQKVAPTEENKDNLDMEEFDALNESIVTAKADDAGVKRFEKLAELYAQKEVEVYQFDEE